MTTRLPTICDSCIHLEATGYGRSGTIRCNAFPDGIPAEVWQGEYDHRDSHPLDNGVTYDMRPGMEFVLEGWANRYERMIQEDPE